MYVSSEVDGPFDGEDVCLRLFYAPVVYICTQQL